MNLEQAKKASKKGAYTSFLLAGWCAIATTYYLFFANPTHSSYRNQLLSDPVNYFTAVLILIAGYGLLKHSRVMAVFSFLLIIASIAYSPFTMGQPTGIIFIVFVLYFFGNAVRGTFSYHRILRKDNPDYRKTPKWQYFLGIPVALFLILLLVVGFMVETGQLPPIEVVTGNKLKDTHKDALRQAGILLPGENIKLIYSEDLFSILESGSILTDKRVISYETENEKVAVYALNLDEVSELVRAEKGDILSDTVIQVFTEDENREGIQLLLSTENNGDEQFIEALSAHLPSNDLDLGTRERSRQRLNPFKDRHE